MALEVIYNQREADSWRFRDGTDFESENIGSSGFYGNSDSDNMADMSDDYSKGDSGFHSNLNSGDEARHDRNNDDKGLFGMGDLFGDFDIGGIVGDIFKDKDKLLILLLLIVLWSQDGDKTTLIALGYVLLF